MKRVLNVLLLGVAFLAIPSESFGCAGGYCGGGYVVVAGGGHAMPPPVAPPMYRPPAPMPPPYGGAGYGYAGGGAVAVGGFGFGGGGGFAFRATFVRRPRAVRCCRPMAVRARCFGGRRMC